MGCATVPPPKTFSNESENQQPHEDGKMPKCDKEMSESEAQPSSEVSSHSSIQESTAQREEPVKDSLTIFDNDQNILEKSMEQYYLSSTGMDNLDMVKKESGLLSKSKIMLRDAHVSKTPRKEPKGYEKYLAAEMKQTIGESEPDIKEKSRKQNPQFWWEKFEAGKFIFTVFHVTNMLAIFMRWLVEEFTKAKIPGGGNCNFTKVDWKKNKSKKKRYLTKKVKQALTVASRAILVGLLISHHGQVEAGSSSKSTQLTCAEPEGAFLSQINGIRICVRPGLLGKDVRRNALLHMRSGGSSKQIPIEISEGTLHIRVSRRRRKVLNMKLELTRDLDTYAFSSDCHRDDVPADPCMRFGRRFKLCFRQECYQDDKHKLVRLVVSGGSPPQACLRVCQKSQG